VTPTGRSLVVLACVAVCAAAPGVAQAKVAHPNPAFVSPQVDYVNPLEDGAGHVASLQPLEPSVTAQAVADQQWLDYQRNDDLGGFVPAPIGFSALRSGGRNVVGSNGGTSQLPQFSAAASGVVRSFAFTGGPPGNPDNGGTTVPGLGSPPTVTPPTNSNAPPPNQGFGGKPTPSGVTTTSEEPTTSTGTTGTSPPPTTTTTTTTRPPPTTTTTPITTTTTTTTPTTTTVPTTTSTSGGGGGSSGGGTPTPVSCGPGALSITSDLADCRIVAVNMAPGDSTVEHVTVRNDTADPFTLSLQASGTPNHLWNDLQMGVWEQGTPAPSPLPALLLWTTQENQLATLAPGASITYVIELALPASAGNDDQGYAAVIDFLWHAQA
jgi:hypothetical protein